MPQTTASHSLIRWFEELSLNDISLAGGKTRH